MKTRRFKLSAQDLKNFAFMRLGLVVAALFLALRASSVDAQAGAMRQDEHHRHKVLEAARVQPWYWTTRRPGMVLATLPIGFVQVSAGGTGYYYFEGVYFRPVAALASGYEVVAPPPGVLVPQLPTGAEPVAVGGSVYYYAGGTFYVQEPTGFAVAPAPLGAVVSTPPLGAVPINLNGAVYFQAADALYQPVSVGGVTLYTTIKS